MLVDPIKSLKWSLNTTFFWKQQQKHGFGNIRHSFHAFQCLFCPVQVIDICNAANEALEHCNAHYHTLDFVTHYTHNIIRSYAINAGLVTTNVISVCDLLNTVLTDEQKAFVFGKQQLVWA